MPGEQLMCVWEAVWVEDDSDSLAPSTDLVRQVVSWLGESNILVYNELKFNKNFRGKTVQFAEYMQYVNEYFQHKEGSRQMALDKTQALCWERCQKAYPISGRKSNRTMIYNLWQIFVRMTEVGSYPPVIRSEEVEWLLDKVALCWNKFAIKRRFAQVDKSYTFTEFLDLLEKDICKEELEKLVEELYDWLIREICMVGWLYKRSRKHSSWTNWMKRWFVLYPDKLEYFEDPSCRQIKGSATITSFSKIETTKSKPQVICGKRFNYGFRLSNSPDLLLDMAASSNEAREAWTSVLNEIIETSRIGLTPVQLLLKNRSSKSGSKHAPEPEEKSARYPTVQRRIKESKRHKQANEITGTHNGVKTRISPKEAEGDQVQEPVVNVFLEQRNKIMAVFNNFDKDGNGYIDPSEFNDFIKNLGLFEISQREIDFIFDLADTDKDGMLSLDNFTDYFIKFAMDEGGISDSTEESKLRQAFFKADQDGTGTVDFREFIEFAWDHKRSVRASKLMHAFQRMDTAKRGEVSFEEFRKFLKSDQELRIMEKKGNRFSLPLEPGHNPCSLERYLRGLYRTCSEEQLVDYLHERWKKTFASFKRYGASGELVMSGVEGMVADVMPGNYTLVDLVCFTDLPPLKPRHASIRGVQWVSSHVPGKSGRCIFPSDYDEKIPVDIATNEHLRYYGCSLADSNQVQVSLLYRHGIQDFTYRNQYLEDYVKRTNGGAGLEKHDFTHLDCPLIEDSGYFILAKFDEESGEFHITAFKVPVRHTAYVPGGIIHSNDYLVGTWRTMLSDEAEIDHVHLVKYKKSTNAEDMEHFVFKFQGLPFCANTKED